VQFSTLEFTPTISNPEGIVLTFTAQNLPDWASIDSDTGTISGTPGVGDVGVFWNITLTVAGGGESITTPGYSIVVTAAIPGSATLTWLPPTEKTDGSPLTDLAGYKIYWGQSQDDLSNSVTIENPGVTAYVLDGLLPATWYFAATAVDSEGMESSFSNVASKTIM
jgi:hypothetical protein